MCTFAYMYMLDILDLCELFMYCHFYYSLFFGYYNEPLQYLNNNNALH